MIEKFDSNRNKFIIVFGISTLILFFNLNISQFSFFDNLKISKNLELYIILFSNSYFFYEIITSYLVIEKKEKTFNKVYLIHFSICSLLFIIIILTILYRFTYLERVFNFTIFSFFALLFGITFWNNFALYKRFEISSKVLSPKIEFEEYEKNNIEKIINTSKNEKDIHKKLHSYISFLGAKTGLELNSLSEKYEIVKFNLFLFLINIFLCFALLIMIIYGLKPTTSYYIFLLCFIFILAFFFKRYIYTNEYFKTYEEKILTLNNLIVYSPWLENNLKNKSTKEIQSEIKNRAKKNYLVVNYSEIENKLINAINSGNLNLVKKLIEENNDLDINSQRNNGWTFLHYSVAQGERKIANFLLENGANPDIKNHINNYPLNYAINYENIEIVKLLLEYHADINIVDFHGFSPIFKAIEKDNLDLFKLLVNMGANIKMKCNGFSILDFAKEHKRGRIIKYIKDISKK